MHVLPWQESDWSRLQAWRQEGRLPHAMIWIGPPGIAQWELAQAWAFALLCEKPTDSGWACGQCTACHWVAAGTHPDLHILQPEDESRTIKIDAVRHCQQSLGQFPHHGERQVVLIEPAEALATASANALLKSLEEPRPGTHFLLLSSAPSRLLPTITSRCQRLTLTIPRVEESEAYWQSKGIPAKDWPMLRAWFPHSPVLALEAAEQKTFQQLPGLEQEWWELARGERDPLALAKKLMDLPETLAFMALTHWVESAIKTSVAEHRAWAQALFRWRDQCYAFQRQILQHNPNRQLLLERLSCQWYSLHQASP